jgi:hypothetical protein
MRPLYYYHELEDMYEELLNDYYEPVSICGMNYAQGHALRNLDPIAFRCGVSDWESEEFDEIHYSDMTESERAHYYSHEGTTMYCRKDENEIDEDEEE